MLAWIRQALLNIGQSTYLVQKREKSQTYHLPRSSCLAPKGITGKGKGKGKTEQTRQKSSESRTREGVCKVPKGTLTGQRSN